jgi:hypothetical protein
VPTCACPERHLDPLGPNAELVFPWAGVLVMQGDYESYSEASAEPQPYGGDLHQFFHGIVHFVQALGSPFLQNHGLRLIRAAHDVVDHPRAVDESFAAEAGRLRRPHPSGVSCDDLLEAAAELEANRLASSSDPTLELMSVADVHGLLLQQLHPDPGAPQRRGFYHVAERIGADDACDLLPLLTFLAFIHDDPCEAFEYLLQAAEHSAESLKTMTTAQLLDRLGWSDGFEHYWDLVAAGEPVGTPYIADPLREAMQRFGRSQLLEVLSHPSRYLLQLPEHLLRAIQPPVIVFPSRAGGFVHHRNGVALDVDPAFAIKALTDVGLVGAAERLTVARESTEPAYCMHDGCPHHETALCSRWYVPPSTAEGHDACGFIREFTSCAGSDPAAVWARTS